MVDDTRYVDAATNPAGLIIVKEFLKAARLNSSLTSGENSSGEGPPAEAATVAQAAEPAEEPEDNSSCQYWMLLDTQDADQPIADDIRSLRNGNWVKSQRLNFEDLSTLPRMKLTMPVNETTESEDEEGEVEPTLNDISSNRGLVSSSSFPSESGKLERLPLHLPVYEGED